MKLVLAMMVVVVASTVGYGWKVYQRGGQNASGTVLKTLGANLAAFLPLLLGALTFMIPEITHAAPQALQGAVTDSGLAYLAAALSTGLATIATGIAMASVGSAAIGAVSEDDKILGKTIIFVGLAEGIAIYGLIISIMILGRV